jgi:Flp pilus assembly pilin Flp
MLLKTRLNKKGMAALEYGILVVMIVLALMTLQTGVRRAISAKWRTAGDVFGGGRQYEPGVTH